MAVPIAARPGTRERIRVRRNSYEYVLIDITRMFTNIHGQAQNGDRVNNLPSNERKLIVRQMNLLDAAAMRNIIYEGAPFLLFFDAKTFAEDVHN